MKPRAMFLVGMILGAAALRLVPHPSNFTPIGALALFAGAQFDDKRWALIVPLAAMLLKRHLDRVSRRHAGGLRRLRGDCVHGIFAEGKEDRSPRDDCVTDSGDVFLRRFEFRSLGLLMDSTR